MELPGAHAGLGWARHRTHDLGVAVLDVAGAVGGGGLGGQLPVETAHLVPPAAVGAEALWRQDFVARLLHECVFL